MRTGRRRQLQIPVATESFSLEEAHKHRNIVRAAEDLFTSWGYLPAQVPVFDYFDGYQPLLDESTLETVYRLIDRDGDLLMLRSDVTLFLAKQMGLLLTDRSLPTRVFYADSILRHQDSEDISHNEFFQIGAELIGKPSLRGDLEIITLLGRVVELLSLSGSYLHIGSRKLFNGLVSTCTRAVRTRAAELLLDRKLQELSDIDEILPAPFGFIGSAVDFAGQCEAWEAYEQRREVREAADELRSIADTLSGLDMPFDVRIDLSEIGAQPYYTGPVFRLYVEGIPTAAASGGRYDELLGHFGFPAPSVGFSLMLRKVEPYVGRTERFAAPDSERIETGDFKQALGEADAVRKSGRAATL